MLMFFKVMSFIDFLLAEKFRQRVCQMQKSRMTTAQFDV